ncbi:MAG: TonB-dependent receptor plug domain-containing protein [Gammaproteobacteria bacterium]|nr:TonB-dependent receptor plug domain-containing protein [Gammaproteobacteria bacterium]
MSAATTPIKRQLAIALSSAILFAIASNAIAQDQPVTDENSTVTYPASYFSQYEPYSVNDMLDRIPGISTARGGGGSSGGPGSSGGRNRRGLGAGGDQVLINGKRVAGKGNEGNNQLSRIPASQVQYIEIIRGTSGDLDVRGGNQVINIVLLEAESRSSVAYELNTDRLHDGTYQPGAKASLTGQNGAFNYFLSGEREPRWQFREGSETSFFADGTLNDTVVREDTIDSWPISLTANLGYDFTDQDSAHFNMQWEESDRPVETDRVITDHNFEPPSVQVEYDDIPSTSDSWEIGGDYEHIFDNGSRFKTLFIVNEAEDDSTRERFIVDDGDFTKDLYLANFERNRERIVRSSYTFDLAAAHNVEIGVERAQTILDSSLQLGLLTGDATSPAFGSLSPVTNSNGTVEEIRYEYFAVHNWQINNRMSLESTILYETSEITQSGDVSKSRDFDFVRPKLDYRFDITPSIQFRASIENDVAQLAFSDFTDSISDSDDDQDSISGNPDLRQEQSWRYEANLEYRLPEDAGVLSANLFYHDLEDVIEKIDVSTDTDILSANGNVGDGERYGISIDSSLRLGFINQPEMLLTAGLQIEDSNVTDPFLGSERRLNRRGIGRFNLGFRHDMPSRNMNWGFRYRKTISRDIFSYDIDKIEEIDDDGFINAWFELQGWADLTYRFEAMDSGNRCRIRSRFIDGTIATGILNEIEDSCSTSGLKLAIKIRGTF